MTLTTEILEAICNNPETVEMQTLDGAWVGCSYFKHVLVASAINQQWRIKPKPYERTHIIYLNETPNSFDRMGTLKDVLVGDTSWDNNRGDWCNKKFEITVREAVE